MHGLRTQSQAYVRELECRTAFTLETIISAELVSHILQNISRTKTWKSGSSAEFEEKFAKVLKMVQTSIDEIFSVLNFMVTRYIIKGCIFENIWKQTADLHLSDLKNLHGTNMYVNTLG